MEPDETEVWLRTSDWILTLPEKILLELAYDGDEDLRQVLIGLNSELPGFSGDDTDWGKLRQIGERTLRRLLALGLIYLSFRRSDGSGMCDYEALPTERVDLELADDRFWAMEFGEGDMVEVQEPSTSEVDVVLFTTPEGEVLYESGAALR